MKGNREEIKHPVYWEEATTWGQAREKYFFLKREEFIILMGGAGNGGGYALWVLEVYGKSLYFQFCCGPRMALKIKFKKEPRESQVNP